MTPVNANELISKSALACSAILMVMGVVLVGGCGGGDGPVAPVAPLVNPQSRPNVSPAGQLARSERAVGPMAASYVGDLDGDGLPGVGDAIKILRFVVGLDTPTSSETWLADVNGHDGVDVGDAIMVLRAVVGLEQWPLPWPGGGGPPPPPF